MPHKDPEARRAYQKRRYEEKKHLWKKPDGSWKQEDAEQRRQRQRRRYADASTGVQRKTKERQKKARDQRRRVGICPICEMTDQRLVRDHCHTTGLTRGWICAACNCLLGYARDRVETILRAASYLLDRAPVLGGKTTPTSKSGGTSRQLALFAK